jgi:hypothetical protein
MSDNGFPDESEFRIRRHRDVVRLQTHNMTNHELRNIMIGIWLALDPDDKRDHIKELEHYLLLDSRPPGMSVVIADAWRKELERDA